MISMRNLTQDRFHISFGALLKEAENGDFILFVDQRYVFTFQDGSLIKKVPDGKKFNPKRMEWEPTYQDIPELGLSWK